jgi:hypothetical protein
VDEEHQHLTDTCQGHVIMHLIFFLNIDVADVYMLLAQTNGT